MTLERPSVGDVRDAFQGEQIAIAAVVVLYHPDLMLLERLLTSLKGQVDRVVAVDNTPGSSVTLAPFLEGFPCPISYLPLGDNKGIAEAQNIGIREGIRGGCSHVLLLDQDSAVSAGMVTNLLFGEKQLLEKEHVVAAVCPQIVDEKTGKRPGAVHYRWFRVRRIDVSTDSDEPIETDNLIASGSLIRAVVLESLGMMRSDLFIEYVDTEWVFRANTAGYKSYCVPTAVLAHNFGDASAKFFGHPIYLYSGIRYYYKLRNAVYLARVKSMGWQWRAYIISRIPYHCFLYSWFSANRLCTARLMLRALGDGLLGRLGPVRKELTTK